MAKPGPKRTPTPILKMRGSWLAGQRDGEPAVPDTEPAMPDWLDAEAAAEWDRLVPVLRHMGLLSVADQGMLAALCVAWGRLVEAVRDERIGTSNWQQRSALAARVNAASKTYVGLAAEFGLSPAARSRVQVSSPEPQDVPAGASRFAIRKAEEA